MGSIWSWNGTSLQSKGEVKILRVECRVAQMTHEVRISFGSFDLYHSIASICGLLLNFKSKESKVILPSCKENEINDSYTSVILTIYNQLVSCL